MINLLKQFGYYFLIFAGIFGSLNFVLFLSANQPQVSALLILFWLLICLFCFRTKKKYRYQHILIILLEVLFTILYAVGLSYILNQYNTFLNGLNPQLIIIFTNLLQFFHLSPPTIQLDLLFVLALALCCLLLTIRSLTIIYLKTNHSKNNHLFFDLYEIAYSRDSEDLFLKPWFKFSRAFSLLLMLLGSGLLIWFLGYGQNVSLKIQWIVWLFPSLIFIGFDWYQWLSGELYKFKFQPSFDGSDTDIEKQIYFEDLWRRYHGFWKKKWLVAGNKSTGEKK